MSENQAQYGKSEDQKKVIHKIVIRVFEDNSVQVEAPPDFLLANHILNLAHRALIDLMAEKRQHDEQRRIMKPSLAASMALARVK